MPKSYIHVIPSKAKDLVVSTAYEDKILRLRLRMTVATQPQGAGEKGGPAILRRWCR